MISVSPIKINKQPEIFEGKWILADYVDPIYKNKLMAPYYHRNGLVWQALFIEIQDSLAFFCGTVYCKNKPIKIRSNTDSLLSYYSDNKHGKYLLYYDSLSKKLILADSTNKKYTFRRFDSLESRILIKKEGVHNAYDISFKLLLQKSYWQGNTGLKVSPNQLYN